MLPFGMRFKPESENAIQSAFFDWVDAQRGRYPALACAFAIPNGSHKSPAARMLFKRTGLKAGVPDVFIPLCADRFKGVFIEFKAKKGRVSDAQEQWITRLRNAGFAVFVCRSAAEAIDALRPLLDADRAASPAPPGPPAGLRPRERPRPPACAIPSAVAKWAHGRDTTPRPP